MTIQQIYQIAIEMGMKNDFRPKKQIEKHLKRLKEKYAALSKKEKEVFDAEKLTNPYIDSRINFNSGVKNIKRVMAGIDIDSAELMVARYLSNHNPKNPIDLAIAHHPTGKGLADLSDVMHLQADVLAQYGVPINVAEGLMKIKISEVSRSINPINHFKAADTARLVNISLMNVHTPADNLVAKFVEAKIKKDKPEYVGDILKSLLEIPEYKEAAKMGFGPTLFTGSEDNRVGKIAFTELTGGTEGSPKIYEKLATAGIGTVISMHQSEEHRKEAEKAHINVVIAGHISSDSIGMNLFLDELEKKGIEIMPCSGLIRINRNKK
ncbi:MAG: NGG1p interacting factor NIF3 [Candidatus Moranbacteria bacterium RIFCSPHIGHO2_02_FULL_40_12b]|nr:MAG: NGG1p interacting factor NIF3 [Candidatus Moranbacteria bacterium RIFCSPHIGHO2_02_FULL_40_12b]OGI23365.1 MAG: NGG1p interacting factor NIF3 [Candidatus Moranbacteria bacterium RIFCSPHIGHO2_12_FULL_40_10]